MSQTSTNTEAHQMLQDAHNRAYRYPADFLGFKARIAYQTDEKRRDGWVIIHSPNDITIEMEGTEAELKPLQHEIASLCGHRWYAPYEKGDGRFTLSLHKQADPLLGQLIVFQDDPFKSSYRIKDGSVVQIHRQMGTNTFTIDVLSHLSAEGNKKLPAQFTVAFWNTEEKRLLRTLVYTDHYTLVASYHLPASRRILMYNDEGVHAHEITFSAHELLSSS